MCTDLVAELAVAIHNKNGQGLLQNDSYFQEIVENTVAIHNKNGQGLLPNSFRKSAFFDIVAIHNKNGQGLLRAT